MNRDIKIVAAAQNIRAALQNLNELVEEAYREHEIVVRYEIRTAPFNAPYTDKILAVISQELA